MDKNLLQKYILIDSKLELLAKDLSYLSFVNPINEKEEKEKFFKEQKTPIFKYKEMDINTVHILDQLDKIQLPEGEFKQFLQTRIDNIKKICLLLNSIGTQNFLQASKDLFGAPSKDLVAKAKELLVKYKKVTKPKDRKKFTGEQLKEEMEKYFRSFGIHDWQIVLNDNFITSVDNKKKSIFLCKTRNFDEVNVQRLLLHEIGVHVLRSENGHNQILPYSFGENTAQTLTTEEGLAIYLQVQNDLMPIGSWRSVLTSVITIDAMISGKTFSEVFQILKDLEFSDEFAWGKCLRTFRGGGLTKDYMYLQGYREIEKYVISGGEIEDLYIGRITTQDVDWIKPQVQNGTLKKPLYIPHV